MAEETVYIGKYRIRVCSIDRLLEGEAPVSLLFLLQTFFFFFIDMHYRKSIIINPPSLFQLFEMQKGTKGVS